MTNSWPDFPIVELVDGQLIIFYEDGSEDVWGSETTDNIEYVRSEIRDGLRAIKYLRRNIHEVIETTFSILSEKGIPHEQRNEYLVEALNWIIPQNQ